MYTNFNGIYDVKVFQISTVQEFKELEFSYLQHCFEH